MALRAIILPRSPVMIFRSPSSATSVSSARSRENSDGERALVGLEEDAQGLHESPRAKGFEAATASSKAASYTRRAASALEAHTTR